ncbi:head maturation protease, ClpP-related [Lysinibacillus capsici]|uniref:head maturation protease, ClpP-related n=1 Tax=Lysinibacillus capsici TaxID=2115968 RepID=UPI001ABF0A54|nr:head maturation protease, ClpP-related [Lysinibacillus capsici]
MKKINIKGAIVLNDHKEMYDWYGVEATCPNDVTSQLVGNEPIEVIINSGGGNVFAGSEIYTALRAYQGDVTIKIYSFAGSSASIIAMARKSEISPTAQLMIHNVSLQSGGDYHDHEHVADILKNANETIANAYVLKTGKSKEEILELMDKETWLSPQTAKELGFIDSIMFEDKTNSIDPVALVANGGAIGMLPEQLINDFKENKAKIKQTAQLKAQLNLLKLKEIK